MSTVLPGALPLPDDELLEQPAAASAATATAASAGASPLLFKMGILSLIDDEGDNWCDK
jgi:hypothetical protein